MPIVLTVNQTFPPEYETGKKYKKLEYGLDDDISLTEMLETFESILRDLGYVVEMGTLDCIHESEDK